MKGCDAYTLQVSQRAFRAGRLAFHVIWEGPTPDLGLGVLWTNLEILMLAFFECLLRELSTWTLVIDIF